MTKHSKRLKKARNNPKGVSYSDFISILENEGYTVRKAGGSHRVAKRLLEGKKFRIVFVKPHGNNKSIHPQPVKDLLTQLDEIAALGESEDDE